MTLVVILLANLLFPFAAAGVVLSFALSPRRRALLGLGEQLRERLGGLPAEGLARLAGRPVLWVHAASAGEVGAVAGFLERLRREPGAPAILLTAQTEAGRGAARRLACVDLAALAPLDCWLSVSRFLSAARPRALVVVETELWPNMLALARRRGLPVALVNARLTQRSFARYRALAPFVRPFVSGLSRLAVQTPGDEERFLRLGARPEVLRVTGNMKYDAAKPAAAGGEAERALERLGWREAPRFTAGSTHPVEEDAVLAAFARARAARPGLRLVIAPRHVERAADLCRALSAAGIPHRRWSQGLPAAADPGLEALVLDAVGVLPAFYAGAVASFVGGTLVPVGGHNLLEPALAGSPVLFGPHTSSTEETAGLLVESGGGARVADADALGAALADLARDPAKSREQGSRARRAAERLQGAVERTYLHCRDLLPLGGRA